MVLGKKNVANIESKFFHSEKIKIAVADARAFQDTKGVTTGGSHGHSRISDPTANLAIKHASPISSVIIKDGLFEQKIREPEKWLKVIEYTYAMYNNHLIGVMAKRRYIDKEKPDYTYDNMRIGKQTYYNWRDDFIYQAAMFAVAEGLLDPRCTTD